MRALCLIMLAATAAHAQDNLMPRQGSGWAGFKVGTKVRVKRTFLGAGRTPAVTITTMTLKSIQGAVLTLAIVSKNAVGMDRKSTRPVPRKGEAGAGETAEVKKLKNKASFAAGKQFDCARRQTTVVGKAYKRVITEWTSVTKPRMRVKRVELQYDAAGKVTQRFSMVLAEMAKEHKVGKRKVTGLKYTTVRTAGNVRTTSTAIVSRDVPGYEVLVDAEVEMNGKKVQTVRVEVLDFETK